MPDDLGYLLGPVSRGWCRLESVFDGTLRLHHFALANDMMDVEAENARRARLWDESHPPRKR